MSRDNLIVPILEEPALKAGNDKETPPTFTLATSAQKQEENAAAELPVDNNVVSLALSSTIIEAQSEVTTDEDTTADFGVTDGAPDFSTLKINKNADKAVEEDATSPTGNIEIGDEPTLDISANETIVAEASSSSVET